MFYVDNKKKESIDADLDIFNNGQIGCANYIKNVCFLCPRMCVFVPVCVHVCLCECI